MFDLKKETLHHAYVITGGREDAAQKFVEFLGSIGLPSLGNPDFFHKKYETFSIDDARELKALHNERAVSGGKKIFVLEIGQFSREAPHALLKIFEEPIAGTHFFILMENGENILPTLASRVITLAFNNDEKVSTKDAKKFIALSQKERLDMIAKLDSSHEKDESSHALKKDAEHLLKQLLQYLHDGDLSKDKIFALKELENSLHYLYQSGSSAKMLLEHVALIL